MPKSRSTVALSPTGVRRARLSAALPGLHRSILDIVGVLNRPERDAELLAAAGLSLERALFPLLVLVQRLGPVGVVDLAGRVGRDHTTVSRQLGRLEALGLVSREPDPNDRRLRPARITAAGEAAVDAVDAAREKAAERLFADWSEADFEDLVRLMRRLADGLERATAAPASES